MVCSSQEHRLKQELRNQETGFFFDKCAFRVDNRGEKNEASSKSKGQLSGSETGLDTRYYKNKTETIFAFNYLRNISCIFCL